MFKKNLINIVLIILITASATFLLTTNFIKSDNSFDELLENLESVTLTSQETKNQILRYRNDDITISGIDENGDEFLLLLDLYRKELEPEINLKSKVNLESNSQSNIESLSESLNVKKEENTFLHYYFFQLEYQGKTYKDYVSFKSNSKEIQQRGFIESFENNLSSDLSTKEDYSISIDSNGFEISAVLENLNGDFITKNTPEYTRYLSVGTATLNINEEIIQTDVAVEKGYSENYTKYIYFDGLQKLQSRTFRFLIWDEEGNFYLIDDSFVKENVENYKTHTWILYKNKKDQFTKKAFDAEITFSEKSGFKNWKINISDLDIKLNLGTKYPTKNNWTEGLIQGSVENVDLAGLEKISGSFSYKKE